MRKTRVLVADDDRHVRTALRARLRSWGYSVVEAHHGLGVIAQVSRERVDAMILDQQMPLGTGSAVGRLLRHECRAPIIFLTGHGPESIPADLLELPEVYYLSKPAPAASLRRVLDQCLRNNGRSTPEPETP